MSLFLYFLILVKKHTAVKVHIDVMSKDRLLHVAYGWNLKEKTGR